MKTIETETHNSFGPEHTPAFIKKFIIFSACFTLICAILDPVFKNFFAISGPQDWFSLSWWGIQHLMLWQIISFPFVQHTTYAGITFGYLITIVINLYLLWIVGSQVLESLGNRTFLNLFFGSIFFSALCTFLSMPILDQYEYIYGFTAGTLGLFTILTMLYPEQEVLFMFVMRVKLKWLMAGVLLAILIVFISSSQFTSLIFYLTAFLYAYLFSGLVIGLRSPFRFTHSFDDRLSNYGNLLREKTLRFRSKGKLNVRKKVSQNDDDFLDAMLEKIARKGENSLSWKERKRMDEISKRKMNNEED